MWELLARNRTADLPIVKEMVGKFFFVNYSLFLFHIYHDYDQCNTLFVLHQFMSILQIKFWLLSCQFEAGSRAFQNIFILLNCEHLLYYEWENFQYIWHFISRFVLLTSNITVREITFWWPLFRNNWTGFQPTNLYIKNRKHVPCFYGLLSSFKIYYCPITNAVLWLATLLTLIVRSVAVYLS